MNTVLRYETRSDASINSWWMVTMTNTTGNLEYKSNYRIINNLLKTFSRSYGMHLKARLLNFSNILSLKVLNQDSLGRLFLFASDSEILQPGSFFGLNALAFELVLSESFWIPIWSFALELDRGRTPQPGYFVPNKEKKMDNI